MSGAVLLLAALAAADAPAPAPAPAPVAAPAPADAIAAERAFAADAQALGQWTAFAKWAAPEGQMFVPQPVKAHDWLKGRKDPSSAVFWWPGHSFVSCDGATAVNTGPWVRQWGKSVGYFTTVWKRHADGQWKWLYDAGDSLPALRAEGGDIAPSRADCAIPPAGDFFVLSAPPGATRGGGASEDGSLRWHWMVGPDGARELVVRQWSNGRFTTVVHDSVGPS